MKQTLTERANAAFANKIEQLEKEGLIQVKFKRKPSSGVHAFFNPSTGEMFYTHTTGYVRRTVEAVPWINRGIVEKRNAPINKYKNTKVPYINFQGERKTRIERDIILMQYEFERLHFLLEYMQRRNKRLAKKK